MVIKMLSTIKWSDRNEANDAFVYSCSFGKSEDFILACAVGRCELQIFERDIVYKPTWTITGQKRGLYTCDASPKGDIIAFGGADSKIYLLDFGKFI